MKKTLILAVLAVAILAAPAFASVQNVKISGDVETIAVVRDQFDLGDPTQSEQAYQNFLATIARLRVDADLTDNVSATIGLISERVWGEENDSSEDDNDVDINLAYVTLREMLYSPLTVTIGRQNFAFGNSFVIDSAGVNNTITDGGLNNVAEDLSKRTAQDAVRMTLDYNPLTIDVIAAKIAHTNQLGTGSQDDDIDLFGVNSNYSLGDDLNTVIEAYFWAKIDQTDKDDALAIDADTVYMPGVRASANLLDGLMVSGEIALQGGTYIQNLNNHEPIQRRAMAAQLIANYKLPFEKSKEYSPVVTTSYTYVSGDSNPDEAGDTSGREGKEYFTSWDPMFENQSGGKIYNVLFNLTNCHVVSVGAQINPMEDLTAGLGWTGLWLDKQISSDVGTLAIGGPDGGSVSSSMTDNKKLGDEVDLSLIYDYTEDVQIGAGMGWFWAKGAFSKDNRKIATQYMLNCKVDF